MTHFLRFTDEPAFHAACESAGLWINDGNPRPLLLSHTHILDVIGPIAQVKVTGSVINWSYEDEGIVFRVGLNADHTGWEYSATATENSELLIATYNVSFFNQDTGDHDNARLEVNMQDGELTVERLVYGDEDNPETVTTKTPASNRVDTVNSSFDAWHVNAKFTAGLPDGWDAYLVTPSSPVRVFAGG
tara:strand:+ start:1850 stop:2416 length:567 start_codon:yes stop_codon:yes gene_type:complete